MARNQEHWGWLELIAGALLAFLACGVNGEDIGWVRGRIARRFIDETADFPRHEAFVDDGDARRRYVVVTGACQMLSIWPAPDEVDARSPIAAQLQREFARHGMPRVAVLNLAKRGFSTTHNLRMFLRFLDDPRYPVFVWQNDLDTTHVEQNQLFWHQDLEDRLRVLARRFPRVPEIPAILARLELHRGAREFRFLGPVPGPRTEPFAAAARRAFRESLGYFSAHLFADDQNAKIREDTFYLRELERRVDRRRFEELPYERPDGGAPLVDENEPQALHADTPGIRRLPAEQASGDNALVLRLMGKLSASRGKKVYVFFGPEGSPVNQEDEVYDRKFRLPLIAAVRGLPAVRVLDMTRYPWEPRDRWGSPRALAMPTYWGSGKIARALFDMIVEDADHALL